MRSYRKEKSIEEISCYRGEWLSVRRNLWRVQGRGMPERCPECGRRWPTQCWCRGNTGHRGEVEFLAKGSRFSVAKRQKIDFLSQQRIWKRGSIIPNKGEAETARRNAVLRRGHAEADAEPPVQQDQWPILLVTAWDNFTIILYSILSILEC